MNRKNLDLCFRFPGKKFCTLVTRLRDGFPSKDDEMFYQQLMTCGKKPDQTWEDLAQEIELLSMKAHVGKEERNRESMATKAFVEAVIYKRVHRKLREKHTRTINKAVKHAQMVEADLI